MPGLEAVAGYALGTLQVLIVDWWRRIVSHRRQLTLLQAELRRLRSFDSTFHWSDGLPPADEKIPRAPKETELFVRTVGEMDWRLTDEHDDDNAQQAFLHLLDGFSLLRFYADKVMEVADLARTATSAEKLQLRVRGEAYANSYDSRLDDVLFQVDDSLREIARRLEIAKFNEQLDRAFSPLPRGTNPAPFTLNDPRLAEWRRTRKSSAS
jgi:hypothetical protein